MINFNGNTLPSWLRVVSIRRDVKPARRATSQVVPGRPGSIFTGTQTEPRTIQVQLRIYEPNKQILFQRVSELASFLHTETPAPLTINDEPGVFYNAIAVGDSDLFQATQFGGVWITFYCHNPFKHALTPTLVPLTTGNTTINNQGSATAFPAIRITGITGSEFIVRHHEQNKECRIVWNFEDWMELEIDMDKEIIRINGNVQMAAFDWRSEMFNINPGINTISTNASPVTGAVEFTTRWL